ncbi:MAG: YhcH/YjgK/YiaL family protein [Christensenellaceae bacterium]|nr:YhcH/YjgK/YiaL family protein [Christensenellaceae bacterium]MEA5066473.1 YhcH/YjgK/YiaL family protein [Eubacteriales bacterium]MEA5067835.1 YhcH/YjgK/YiaL family protein [Christensenellaceae bacterium]
MIYDSLDRLAAYRGMNPALDRAIAFLRSHDPESFPDGRVEIDGDKVYASVMTVTHQSDGLMWEAHRLYADIQISFLGAETIECLPASQVEAWEPYQPDIQLSRSAQSGIPLPMHRHCFAIFFPWDAHRPNQGMGTGRKMVVKVRI